MPSRGGSRATAVLLGAWLMLLPAAAGAEPPCPTCLVAGAAALDVPIPSGTPLGGYGALARRLLVPDVLGRYPHAFWFRPHEAVHDPPAARAIVLEGGGRRVVWLSVDLVAVDGGLRGEVERRLGFRGDGQTIMLLSATHTHSGPGAFADSAVMGFLTLDRLDAEVRERIVETLVEVARRADRGKRRATVGAIAVPGPDVTVPRLDPPVDRGLVVMKIAGADGRPIALVWNFAIHGTMLGPRNVDLSGDVMGVTSRALERALGVPALYVNGSVGDVSPRGHGAAAMESTARELAESVRSAWSRIARFSASPPVVVSERLDLVPAALTLRHCLGRWLPGSVRLPLGRLFPREVSVVAGMLGDAAWVTIPGELTSSLGVRIKQAGRRIASVPFVAGVSNDYLGYFVAREEWGRPSYVTCASLYGPRAGECLADTAAALFERLGRGGPAAERRPTACAAQATTR